VRWLASTTVTIGWDGWQRGAGQTFVGLTLAGFAIGSIARFRAGPNLDLSATMALFDIHVALYVASWAFGAMFMAAAAGLRFRSRALPLWLSIGAAIAALVNLAAVALPTTPIASFPILLMWLCVVAASQCCSFDCDAQQHPLHAEFASPLHWQKRDKCRVYATL
jgi:hypothetical protein